MTAPGTRFGCPQCGVKLRIQSDSPIERRIVCPRCQTLLRVRFQSPTETVQVEPIGPAAHPTPPLAAGSAPMPTPALADPLAPERAVGSATAVPPPQSSPEHSPPPVDLPPPERAWSLSLAANRWWLVGGGLVALILLGIVLSWRLGDEPRSRDSGLEIAPGEPTAQRDPATSAPLNAESTGTADLTPPKPGDPQSDPGQPLRERLQTLHAPLVRVVEQTGSFPPAVVGDPSRTIESRLSWLAFLAHEANDNSPPVDWNSDWNAPVNDRFVRRRLVEFQNPLIPQLTGDDGYPASHFVGLAGIGPEVFRPDPPSDQVGVFAPDRRVSLPQIRDGLAQTAVVTGSQTHLGSWGAGGRPTIRSFQSQPVIGGPDGLGTGQAESLLLLMADGRVQPVGAEVDPEVFRRMLTIAGEELEETPAETEDAAADEIPGPGSESAAPAPNVPLAESQPVLEPVLDDDDQPPLSPGFAGDDEQPRRQVNPRVALAQKLVEFEQPIRSRRDVLWGVRDLVGVPVRFEGVDVESRLRDRVGFKLRDVTVQQVLEQTLAESGLDWRIEQGQIVVFVADNRSGKR